MKIKIKKYKRWVVFIILCITGLLLSHQFLTMRDSDEQIFKEFSELGQTPVISYDKFNNIMIRSILDKPLDSDLPTIIFLHGAPGSIDNYYQHLRDPILQKRANLVAIDRLGYGYSNFGTAETSIEKQSQVLDFIAQKYTHDDIIVSGWSYGGPILAKSLIENDIYAYGVMVAPAISPADEKHFVLGYLAKWKLTRWLIPPAFVVAEKEKLAHAHELLLLEQDWDRLDTPIIHIHGTDDAIAPYENLTYMKSQLDDNILTTITIPGGGHSIHFNSYDLIRDEFIKILDNL